MPEAVEDRVNVRVGVAGATGYAGAGVTALLSRHPAVDLVQVSSRSHAGRTHSQCYPGSDCDLVLQEELDGAACDVVISALPVGESGRRAQRWLSSGALVIDIAADFRLRDPASFRRWYGEEHPDQELLAEAVLALPELDPEPLSSARLMALPGCFSTAVILACGPACRSGLVEQDIVVDAKTGISGAGRTAGPGYLFSELDGSVLAYSASGHRHQPEMEQALNSLSPNPHQVTFVPHLVPMTRGIVATCYLRLRSQAAITALRHEYSSCYAGTPFIRLHDGPKPSKLAIGTNLCYLSIQEQGNRVVICAVIDNLGRGAATQAVQVLNQRLGLDATTGLNRDPLWP